MYACCVQKLNNRIKQFSVCVPDKWSAVQRKRIDYILAKGMAYISSEESGTDSDGRKVLHRKSLPWLRKKYRKSLQLDDMHFDNLSTKSKNMTYAGINSPDKSVRKQLDDIPDYLLAQRNNSDTI